MLGKLLAILLAAVAVLGVIAVSSPRLVHAQENVTQAREHYGRAMELLDEEGYVEAVIEFKRAYELSPNYSVLYNLGMAYVAMGKAVDAVDALEKYLEEGADKIKAARRVVVEQELKRQRARIAFIVVEVTPSAARVRIDGRLLDRSEYGAEIRVEIGEHRVEVDARGHAPAERTVTTAGGQHETLVFELEPTQAALASAQLQIECDVLDAEVIVDDRHAGNTPLKDALVLPAGAHSIIIRRPGYEPSIRELDLQPGAIQKIRCELRVASSPDPRLMFTLTVKPSEPSADVWVDGQPFAGGELPGGRHSVRVSVNGFDTWEEIIDLKQGGETVEVILAPTAGTVASQRTGASSQRTWAYVLGVGGLVVVGVAAGLYVWTDGQHGDWEQEQTRLDDAWAEPPPFDEDLESRQRANDTLIEDVQSYDSITAGVAVAGGAMLVAGVVLYLTGESPDKYGDVAIVAQPQGAALHWRQRW